MSRWLLIDGNNWVNVDYFGEMKNGGNVETMRDNFMHRVFDCNLKLKTDRVCVCFDGACSWRKMEASFYKSGREEKTQKFWDAYALIYDAVASSIYELHCKETLEADDLIAGLCQDALAIGAQAVIMSSDKDLHQCLVDGKVTQCTSVDRVYGQNIEFKWMTAKGLLSEFGVEPWQWVEYRLLTGDKSDTLPGCKGIGPDKAMKILVPCKTLEGFLANPLAAKISSAKRQIVIDFCRSDQIELLKRLISLGKQQLC